MTIYQEEVFMILILIKNKTKCKIFNKMTSIKIRSFKYGTRIKMMKELNKVNTNISSSKTIKIKNLIFCNINNRKQTKSIPMNYQRFNSNDSCSKLEEQTKLKSLRKC